MFFLIILIVFFYSCTNTYTLNPCYKTKFDKTYSKVNVFNKAKLKLEAECTNNIKLKNNDNEYSFSQRDNIYIADEYLDKGVYNISPSISKVSSAEFIYEEEFLTKLNLKENKLKEIEAGISHNSVSSCLADTDDWFFLSKKSSCKYKTYNISLNTIYKDNINFEILIEGKSKGLLELNKIYSFDSNKKILIHVFINNGSYIYPYFINIEEKCYPKHNKVKVLGFVIDNISVLLNSGSDEGIVKNMKFFYIDSENLKICTIETLSKTNSVCVFKDLNIKSLAAELEFYSY